MVNKPIATVCDSCLFTVDTYVNIFSEGFMPSIIIITEALTVNSPSLAVLLQIESNKPCGRSRYHLKYHEIQHQIQHGLSSRPI